jgi:hypothetical protein
MPHGDQHRHSRLRLEIASERNFRTPFFPGRDPFGRRFGGEKGGGQEGKEEGWSPVHERGWGSV